MGKGLQKGGKKSGGDRIRPKPLRNWFTAKWRKMGGKTANQGKKKSVKIEESKGEQTGRRSHSFLNSSGNN